MPGNQDPAEQVKFLVSCIGNTNNGRVSLSFSTTHHPTNNHSLTLPLLLKSSASSARPQRKPFPQLHTLQLTRHRQKRYERMLKANGVSGTKPPVKATDAGPIPTPQVTPVKRKAAAARSPASTKKAKGKAGKEVKKEEEMDDDDDGSAEDTKKGVKKEEDSASDISGTFSFGFVLICVC